MKTFTFVNLFLSLIFHLNAQFSQAEVWVSTNSWTKDWEKKYSEWVQKEWNTDIFSRPYLPSGQKNPYSGLRTDCADTVYSMRVIFSYENKLPVAFHDPTGGRLPITNQMRRWDSLSETQRIRSFLIYIFDMLSTRSLPDDSYPVAISKSTIRPGVFLLTTQKNHHSWTLKQMLPIGVPWLIFNSVLGAGQGSELQQRQSWPNPYWVFEEDFTLSGSAGFRDWRHPEYVDTPVWQIPGYSEEQYRIPLPSWTETVQKKIATSIESPEEKINRLIQTVCQGVQSRVNVVNQALAFLRSMDHKCMTTEEFDNYSTPNRDQRVFDDFMSLRMAWSQILSENSAREINEDLKLQLNKIYPGATNSPRQETMQMQEQMINENSICITEISPGRRIDLAEAKRRWFLGLISNNPHDGLEQRWGETTISSVRAGQCPVYETWKPQL